MQSCSRAFAIAPRAAPGSRSAACGSSPTPTCRPAKVLRASCSMASAISSEKFGKRSRDLLAARLFRLLAGAAAIVEAGGNRELLHHQGQLVGEQQIPLRPVLVGRARRLARARAHFRQSARRLQRTRGSRTRTSPTWRNFRAKAFHDETLLAVGYGDGGGGVTPEMIERQKLLEHFPALPAAEWRRVERFFRPRARNARAPRACRAGAAKCISSCIARR